MNNSSNNPYVLSDEVATALSQGRGVVALETTIVVHGLPAPVNLEVARECEDAVRASGAVPATIGVIDGVLHVGLTLGQLGELADEEHHALKLSARDLGLAVAARKNGATTVAGTIAVARRAGIDVMATGGLGGVHRDAVESFDESADLTAMSRYQVVVVASGVKSILDIGATLERLDTLGVPVVGYQTSQFPGFYRSDSGFALDWSVANEHEVVAAFVAHREFTPTGFLLANPVAVEHQLDAALHEEALESALALVQSTGVSGKDVTPVLLGEFARYTAGASVEVNRVLVVANAELAGKVATALASAGA